MESEWSGDAENAFFSSEKIDKHRVLLQPEYEYSARSSKSAYYVLGVDVGRLGCTTEVCVFKVTPQIQGAALKSLVNLYTYDAEDFEKQSIHIKKLFYRYKARVCAIDANGLGIGLIDFLTKSQIDPESGDTLPPFGVEGGTNADTVEIYKKIRGKRSWRRCSLFNKSKSANKYRSSYLCSKPIGKRQDKIVNRWKSS